MKIEIIGSLQNLEIIKKRASKYTHVIGPVFIKLKYKLIFEHTPELTSNYLFAGLEKTQLSIFQNKDQISSSSSTNRKNEELSKKWQLAKRGYSTAKNQLRVLNRQKQAYLPLENHGRLHEVTSIPQNHLEEYNIINTQIRILKKKLHTIKNMKGPVLCSCGGKIIIRAGKIFCKKCGTLLKDW